MTEPNYKTLLTSKFVEDLRSVYNSVWENREEIRAEIISWDQNDLDWGKDLEWDEIGYFIHELKLLAEYLEEK